MCYCFCEVWIVELENVVISDDISADGCCSRSLVESAGVRILLFDLLEFTDSGKLDLQNYAN